MVGTEGAEGVDFVGVEDDEGAELVVAEGVEHDCCLEVSLDIKILVTISYFYYFVNTKQLNIVWLFFNL